MTTRQDTKGTGRKLALTGAVPSVGYDAKVKGCPPTEMRAIRRGVAASMGGNEGRNVLAHLTCH